MNGWKNVPLQCYPPCTCLRFNVVQKQLFRAPHFFFDRLQYFPLKCVWQQTRKCMWQQTNNFSYSFNWNQVQNFLPLSIQITQLYCTAFNYSKKCFFLINEGFREEFSIIAEMHHRNKKTSCGNKSRLVDFFPHPYDQVGGGARGKIFEWADK